MAYHTKADLLTADKYSYDSSKTGAKQALMVFGKRPQDELYYKEKFDDTGKHTAEAGPMSWKIAGVDNGGIVLYSADVILGCDRLNTGRTDGLSSKFDPSTIERHYNGSTVKGRVYVTVNNKGELSSITYYDNRGKRTKQIDLLKEHKGIKPHVHHGYKHNERDSKKDASKLTTKEKNLVDRIETKMLSLPIVYRLDLLDTLVFSLYLSSCPSP